MVSPGLDKSAFLAPYLWDNLQNVHKCVVFVPLGKFRKLNDFITDEVFVFYDCVFAFCLHFCIFCNVCNLGLIYKIDLSLSRTT